MSRMNRLFAVVFSLGILPQGAVAQEINREAVVVLFTEYCPAEMLRYKNIIEKSDISPESKRTFSALLECSVAFWSNMISAQMEYANHKIMRLGKEAYIEEAKEAETNFRRRSEEFLDTILRQHSLTKDRLSEPSPEMRQFQGKVEVIAVGRAFAAAAGNQ